MLCRFLALVTLLTSATALCADVVSNVSTLPQRTFVSSTGSDANACTRTAPCRNFTAAIAAVAAGGEVVVLDSAGYGTVTIMQSVSIVAPPGVYAGITALGTNNGITITASGATVALRGLSINGLPGARGIDATAVDVLNIENCAIRSIGSTLIDAGLRMGSPGLLFVNDTAISDVFEFGILVDHSSGTVSGVMDGVKVEHAIFDNGIHFEGATTMTLRNSIIANSGFNGVAATGPGTVTLENCLVANNFGSGVVQDGPANIVLSNNVITGNDRGTIGFISSFGNNKVHGNTTANIGVAFTVVPQN